MQENQKINLYRGALGLMVVLCLLFAVRFLSEFRSYGMMEGKDVHTLSLSGHGEVQGVPDIANISFTISKEAKTVKEAQDAVAKVEKRALDFLKGSGVADKDIKATNASFYPKYDYQKCPATTATLAEPWRCSTKQVISGYESSESITLKVRNIDDTGKIIQGLGPLGVSNLNGPNFSVDNEDGLKAEARKKAIVDAQEKAKVLAKDLGVRLGRISSFSESGGGYPMMYMKAGMMADSAPASLQLPKGEKTISSDVTITYEIR